MYSEKGIGTTVHVYFPVLESQTADQQSPAELPLVRGRNEHILLVDDEEDILAITENLLLQYGYRVTSFTDGREALAFLEDQPEAFDLVLTDMTMPHITGAELARQVLAIVPTMPVMLCTGHSEIINREKALAMGVRVYCEKPLRIANLLIWLREVLDNPPADWKVVQ